MFFFLQEWRQGGGDNKGKCKATRYRRLFINDTGHIFWKINKIEKHRKWTRKVIELDDFHSSISVKNNPMIILVNNPKLVHLGHWDSVSPNSSIL